MTENGSQDPWGVVCKIIMGKIAIDEAMSSIRNSAGGSLTYRESIRVLSDELLPRENVDDYK